MLVIKTGMSDEAAIAKACAAPGTLILSGVQTVAMLTAAVPSECRAILSFGLCGGLSPQAQIGQVFIGDVLIGPDGGSYIADVAWRKRLFAATRYYERHWYSSGIFNQADDPASRIALYNKTGAWVIDDESLFVAQFAQERGIPFQLLRSVSDGATDTVPPAARNALNSDGSSNVHEVMASVLSDPAQLPDLIRIGEEYFKSLAQLRTAALQVGPAFQCGMI